MRVAFYAPMKPPDHPVPSGDRRMARALIEALGAAGHRVELATRLRAFDGSGDERHQVLIRARARGVAERLVARYRSLPRAERPEAWFTYHVHHKAPDWIGPVVARALGVPYVVAEASYAAKRSDGPWAVGFAGALAAIRAADAHLVLTELDRDGLRAVVPARRIVRLPPFLDPGPFMRARPTRARLARRHGLDPDAPWLLTVAMMRPGDKAASYGALGVALDLIRDVPWQAIIVGDGPAAPECRAPLERLGRRIRFVGALRPTALPAYYATADLFVWPGMGEAYGMAYLESQAAGCPVVAGAEPGVRAVVCDGRSGLLAPPRDAAALAAAIRRLLGDPALRASLGARARAWVTRHHGPEAAARALDRAFTVAGAPR